MKLSLRIKWPPNGARIVVWKSISTSAMAGPDTGRATEGDASWFVEILARMDFVQLLKHVWQEFRTLNGYFARLEQEGEIIKYIMSL
ncbi:hypothetical protein [Geomesophilobacter sediminis]|uniref:Uncharacterized protein n=1 Tax=Geomesophilobacter sediminis TaxID=2798584 RepID=A0A8J7M3G8_9BACT|nr:hypothetical protein [Geomesophilobacter sediminis]MBJ6728023.1 hypothetical protein [Geomesophilobacter sediminis]